MKVTASNFKAYDIRGVVGQTLNEELAEALGRAFGTEAKALGEKAVAVGRDGRLSGPGLVAALIRGLREQPSLDLDAGQRVVIERRGLLEIGTLGRNTAFILEDGIYAILPPEPECLNS